jgi:hypothetical protein
MVNYLMCQLGQEGEEFGQFVGKKLYKRTENLINSINILPETKKSLLQEPSVYEMFYEIDADGKIIGFFPRPRFLTNEVALSPLQDLCPNGKVESGFLESCLRGGPLASGNRENLSSQDIQRFEDVCRNICDFPMRYINDPLGFEEHISKSPWLSEVKSLGSQALMRLAQAYRVGGREYAEKIWDSIPNDEVKKNLKNYPKSLEYINCREFGFDASTSCQKKLYPECEEFIKKIVYFLCELEVKTAPTE